MCCSTGVCGAEVDPALVTFAGDLEAVAAGGATVRRFNLGSDAQAFMRSSPVREALQREGTACLPLIVAGGEIVARGRYPAREELSAWAARAPLDRLSPEPLAMAQPSGGCLPGSGCC
jgi:hypothetical protein